MYIRLDLFKPDSFSGLSYMHGLIYIAKYIHHADVHVELHECPLAGDLAPLSLELHGCIHAGGKNEQNLTAQFSYYQSTSIYSGTSIKRTPCMRWGTAIWPL